MKLEVGEQCPVCQKGTFEFSFEDVELTYHGDSTTVTELETYTCNVCGEGFYSKTSERKLDKTFADLRRANEGLLTSDELKEIRSSNNLSQEQLSKLLGMAPKTLARYETGTVIQSRSTDLLLRLIRDNPQNLEYLGNYVDSMMIDESTSSPRRRQ